LKCKRLPKCPCQKPIGYAANKDDLCEKEITTAFFSEKLDLRSDLFIPTNFGFACCNLVPASLGSVSLPDSLPSLFGLSLSVLGLLSIFNAEPMPSPNFPSWLVGEFFQRCVLSLPVPRPSLLREGVHASGPRSGLNLPRRSEYLFPVARWSSTQPDSTTVPVLCRPHFRLPSFLAAHRLAKTGGDGETKL
jgi:hypothetical protein